MRYALLLGLFFCSLIAFLSVSCSVSSSLRSRDNFLFWGFEKSSTIQDSFSLLPNGMLEFERVVYQDRQKISRRQKAFVKLSKEQQSEIAKAVYALSLKYCSGHNQPSAFRRWGYLAGRSAEKEFEIRYSLDNAQENNSAYALHYKLKRLFAPFALEENAKDVPSDELYPPLRKAFVE